MILHAPSYTLIHLHAHSFEVTVDLKGASWENLCVRHFIENHGRKPLFYRKHQIDWTIFNNYPAKSRGISSDT